MPFPIPSPTLASNRSGTRPACNACALWCLTDTIQQTIVGIPADGSTATQVVRADGSGYYWFRKLSGARSSVEQRATSRRLRVSTCPFARQGVDTRDRIPLRRPSLRTGCQPATVNKYLPNRADGRLRLDVVIGVFEDWSLLTDDVPVCDPGFVGEVVDGRVSGSSYRYTFNTRGTSPLRPRSCSVACSLDGVDTAGLALLLAGAATGWATADTVGESRERRGGLL